MLDRHATRAATLALLLSACATAPVVTRMDAAEVRDVSGRWNDTDARLVAEEMIADSLAHPWLASSEAQWRRQPVVIVTGVRNFSTEHIDTGVFVEELQRALINSGRVQFVASADERGQLRDERWDQERNASDATRKAHGQETGADFALTGQISSVVDRSGGESVTLYQVNLKLVQIESNRIVWNGLKKIKKNVVRAAVGW
jgi:uncharacterized protein (TIGR02722 family)